MPFGISSAPKVFQRKIYEPNEGMSGNEVVVLISLFSPGLKSLSRGILEWRIPLFE